MEELLGDARDAHPPGRHAGLFSSGTLVRTDRGRDSLFTVSLMFTARGRRSDDDDVCDVASSPCRPPDAAPLGEVVGVCVTLL